MFFREGLNSQIAPAYNLGHSSGECTKPFNGVFPIPDYNNYGDTIIHRTCDDSYVIHNNTYHVPNEGEWAAQWAEVHAYALAHPECVTEELPPPDPTAEEQQAAWATAVRSERDARIAATDYLAMPDYPAPDETTRATWLAYRQALRDITEADGFPWAGVDSAPWPTPPAPITIKQSGTLSWQM